MLRPSATFIGLVFAAVTGVVAFADELPLDRAHVERSADRDVVFHAAGAVEVRLPAGWHLWEVTQGREMRLVLSPSPANALGGLPDDGVWLTYHVRSLTAADERGMHAELNEMLARRVRLATDNLATFGHQSALRIGPWPAVKQEFDIATTEDRSSSAAVTHTGYHILSRTTWGICELHAVSPVAWFDRRAEQFDRIVADLILREPQHRPQSLSGEIRDAAPIIGTWRSYRSRVKLNSDGRIEIFPDKQITLPVAIQSSGEASNETAHETAKKILPLTGRFEARGDVLLVRWQDGSRLNYRWTLAGDELLLTDHDGQISQLRRILE
jgi:hypothetical protein